MMQPTRTVGHQNNRMSEKVILNGLREGKREALGLLWQAHSTNVLNLAFRMLKDRDQAEDTLMDVFVQVPEAIQKFRGESALGTWLFRLTVNACLMKLRAQKRHGVLEETNLDTIVENALGNGLEQDDLGDCDPELLEMGLSQLPPQTRSMLWLKDAENLDVKDLAEIYSMPEGTVKAKLSRARHFVKDYLKEKLNYAKRN